MCNHLESVDTIELENVTVNIYPDDCNESPREWDNLGFMACWHNRYNLGDEIKRDTWEDYKYYLDDPQAFMDWLEVNKNQVIALPLYLYDHSGLTMSCDNSRYPFCDRWDSGQVGFIFVTFEKLRNEYNWKRISKARKDKITQYLLNEVEIYDQYLTGDVYGYKVVCNQCGDELDSCWGFYGQNWKENSLLESANDHNDCVCSDRLELALS